MRPVYLLQDPRGVEEAKELDEFGHESCPTGLVTGAQPGTIVAMEIFIEVDVVAPVGSFWNFSVPL